jgi:hypothetical protein
MIRFLQTNNRMTKAIFVVIIGVVSVGMVVYLIPGLTGQGASNRRHLRHHLPPLVQPLLSSGLHGQPAAGGQDGAPQLAQQRYPDSPMILGLFEQRVGSS